MGSFPALIFKPRGGTKMENVIYARLDGLSYENAIIKAKQLLNNTGKAVNLTTTISENDKETTSIMQGDKLIGLLTHVMESYKLGKEQREEEYYTVERLDDIKLQAGSDKAPEATHEPSQANSNALGMITPEESKEATQAQNRAFKKAVNFGKAWLLDNFDLSIDLPIKLESLPDAKAGYYKPNKYIVINDKLDPALYLIVLKHELLHYALHAQGMDFTDDSQTFKTFTKVLNLPQTGINLEKLQELALQ